MSHLDVADVAPAPLTHGCFPCLVGAVWAQLTSADVWMFFGDAGHFSVSLSARSSHLGADLCSPLQAGFKEHVLRISI